MKRLASFLKKRELRGIARIFFENGRLLLDLILCNCRINSRYAVLQESIADRMVFSRGALAFTPVILSTLLLQCLIQQIGSQRTN